MFPKLEGWLVFSVLALIIWGLWGFFPKLATNYLDPKSVLIWEVLGGMLVGLGILVALNFKPALHPQGILFALLTGIAGIAGALFFLYALSQGKAPVVIAITALYPLVTILLVHFIFKEPITIQQGSGIILAILAIMLMTL